MDITQLILDDHQEQRRLFAQIDELASTDAGALSAVWSRLRSLLDAHAEAEERFFYPELLKIGRGSADHPTAEDETRDAIEDHNELRDAAIEVDRHLAGSPEWLAAVARVNHVNGNHMAEEERQGLTDFRRNATVDMRHELAVRFARFSAEHLTGVPPVDKNVDDYIAANR